MYHGVDDHENTNFNLRHFAATNFEKHIVHYRKHYNVISLPELFDGLKLVDDRPNVAVTFDDGYRNNFTHALPILERYQCAATFFISGLNAIGEEILWADLLDICGPRISANSIEFNGISFQSGSHGRFPELRKYIREHPMIGSPLFPALKTALLSKSGVDLSDPSLQVHFRLMSDEQIKEVARSRTIRIGSHAMYHNNLGAMSTAAAMDEIHASRRYLEDLTQYPIDSIGYPDGSYTPELAAAAHTIGVHYQCAVDFRRPSDASLPYLRDRIGLYPPCNVNEMDFAVQRFAR